MKSIANWVEKIRNMFKDSEGKFVERTWENLRDLRYNLDNDINASISTNGCSEILLMKSLIGLMMEW